MENCNKCGVEISAGDAFCLNCGSEIKNNQLKERISSLRKKLIEEKAVLENLEKQKPQAYAQYPVKNGYQAADTDEIYVHRDLKGKTVSAAEFKRGAYLEAKKKKSGSGLGFSRFLILIIVNLVILGSVLLNFGFTDVKLLGYHPIENILGAKIGILNAENNYEVLVNAADSSLKKTLLSTLKYSLTALAGFAALSALLTLLLAKSAAAVKRMTNFCLFFMFLAAAYTAAALVLNYGFKDITNAVGLLAAMGGIVLLYFIVNISIRNPKKIKQGDNSK